MIVFFNSIFILSKISKINSVLKVSRFPVGSSANITLGSFINALQIATRCFYPLDNS